jgi:DNA-binding response OmpR family regulator
VRNIPTRGASFTVELPFQSTASMPTFAPAQATEGGRGGRILLADPDDSVLEAVGTILRGREHRVQTARDTQEARALLEKLDFDLIVADVEVLDGANEDSLEGWLTLHKPVFKRRVIRMCAVAPPRSGERKIAESGGGHILQKPFKASELLAAVDEMLLSNVGAIER